MVGVVGSSPIAPTRYKPKQVVDLLGLFGFWGYSNSARRDESGTNSFRFTAWEVCGRGWLRQVAARSVPGRSVRPQTYGDVCWRVRGLKHRLGGPGVRPGSTRPSRAQHDLPAPRSRRPSRCRRRSESWGLREAAPLIDSLAAGPFSFVQERRLAPLKAFRSRRSIPRTFNDRLV